MLGVPRVIHSGAFHAVGVVSHAYGDKMIQVKGDGSVCDSFVPAYNSSEDSDSLDNLCSTYT